MALPTKQQKHIEAWQTSGLSQVAYCRQHKLNAKTFTNWLRAYREEQLSGRASKFKNADDDSGRNPVFLLMTRPNRKY